MNIEFQYGFDVHLSFLERIMNWMAPWTILDLISLIIWFCSKDAKKVVLGLFHTCVMCCVWYAYLNSLNKVEVSWISLESIVSRNNFFSDKLDISI